MKWTGVGLPCSAVPQVDEKPLWLARLRWRRSGAWQWPAFAVGVVADTLVVHFLPFAGDERPGLIGPFLLAGFLNLGVVAALGPLLGHSLSRRRPAVPRFVADDRAGTAMVAALFATLLVAGLAHRPAVQEAEDDFAAQAAAARQFIAGQAPREFQANAGRLNTWKQGPDQYRTCAPGHEPESGHARRWWCVFVRTDQSPPGVTHDPDQQSNAKIAGPDNPGRAAP